MNIKDEQLTHIRPLHEWYQSHKRRGGKIFPTYASLQWFLRNNEQAIRDKQVLLPGTGSRVTMVTQAFGSAVYDLLFKSIRLKNGCKGE